MFISDTDAYNEYVNYLDEMGMKEEEFGFSEFCSENYIRCEHSGDLYTSKEDFDADLRDKDVWVASEVLDEYVGNSFKPYPGDRA